MTDINSETMEVQRAGNLLTKQRLKLQMKVKYVTTGGYDLWLAGLFMCYLPWFSIYFS